MSRLHKAFLPSPTLISLAPLLAALGVLALASAALSAPLLYPEPLSRKYHRIEAVVPPGFKPSCTSSPGRAQCKVSIYTTELLNLFNLNARPGIRIETRRASRDVIFTFDDPKLVFQEKLLEGPPRWIIEIGYPEILIQPIEDELPFRPYPMPVQSVRLRRPNIALDPLVGEGDEVETFNRCWSLWSIKKYVDAYAECSKISTITNADRPTARAATRLIGEILYAYLKAEEGSHQDLKGYEGSQVLVRGSQVTLRGDPVYPVLIGYVINGKAAKANLIVRDAKGGMIYKAEAPVKEPGQLLQVQWSGEDSSSSNLPAGQYMVEIEAIASAEEASTVPLTAQTYVEGTIEGVTFDYGHPEFIVNGRRVRLSEVVLPGKSTFGVDDGHKYFFTDDPNKSPRDIAIERLKKAKQAATSYREKARYVLLATDLINAKSFNEANQFLRDARSDFRQTEGEPFLLAERAHLLITNKLYDEARKVLNEIQRLETQQEDVMGTRLLALASLEYARGDFNTATKLYDEAVEKFPSLLVEESGPIFQLAELYFRSRRLAEAKPFYQDFLARFPNATPYWVAQIRLVQLRAFERPQESYNDMIALTQSLSSPEDRSDEGKHLAALYSLNLANKSNMRLSPESVFKLISKGSPSDYVLEELWMQKARFELQRGKIKEAFEAAQNIVLKRPNSTLLTESSLFFERVLLLHVEHLLEQGENVEIILLYIKNKKRFSRLACKGLLYLYIGRAMRELKMFEKGDNPQLTSDKDRTMIQEVLTEGLSRLKDKNIEALLLLELIGVYRETIQTQAYREGEERTVISHFKYTFNSLEQTFPKRFDNYEYWAARGFYNELQGQLRQAKELYLFALNGPQVKPHERLALAESIYDVYLKMPDYDKALNALTVLLNIYDEYKAQLNMPSFRVNALWRRVELHIEREGWAELIPAIQEYIEESQNTISALNETVDDSESARESAFIQAELELDRRYEAQFYQGYAFLKIGDERSAKRIWDLLYKEAPKHVYGRLAEYELFMLSWRKQVAPEVLKLADQKPRP